jgi:glycosyltransferase involved in cell wall biosynthesis
MKWVCCQLGAREHYAIPRTLFRLGILECLLTDAWVPPGSLVAMLGRGQRSDISSRWHQELRDAPVRAFTASLLMFELLARARRLTGWDEIIARNEWFQRKVVDFLTSDFRPLTSGAPILFAYSYAARNIFRLAKERGWRTVLGQIDPGPIEERIVAEEVARAPELAGDWKPAPPLYWDSWREECELADRIIVNSQWSRDCLAQAGVAGEKLSVIPLAYEMSKRSEVRASRKHPARFTRERPLRVLFLGQVNLRKGVARLLNAIRLLEDEPIEFLMIGPVQITVPEDLRSNRKIRWVGPVARNSARRYYEQADVFILPTLSDGFALTQLEASAHRLPVIASRRCGDVVIDRVNGLLLGEPTAEAIEEALRVCLDNPDQLAQFSENATIDERFSLSHLGTKLCALAV